MHITTVVRSGCLKIVVLALIVWLTAPREPSAIIAQEHQTFSEAIAPEIRDYLEQLFEKRQTTVENNLQAELFSLPDLPAPDGALRLVIHHETWTNKHAADDAPLLVIEHNLAPYRGKQFYSLKSDGTIVAHADHLFFEKKQQTHYIGGFLLSISLICLSAISPALLNGLRSKRWPKVPGTIISCGIGAGINVPGQDGGLHFPLALEYRFVFQGQEYIGTNISLADSLYRSEEAASDVAKLYPVGQDVSVSVPPAEPSLAVLEPGTDSAHWIALALSIGVPLLLWLGLLFLR